MCQKFLSLIVFYVDFENILILEIKLQVDWNLMNMSFDCQVYKVLFRNSNQLKFQRLV